MRFPVEKPQGRSGRRLAALCLLLLSSTALAACGSSGGTPPPATSLARLSGPQADYPLTIGNPYTIGEVTYRPGDTLNYDEVGYATVGSGAGVTGAHHTLPVPSYVEVTSLESGRTILVRLETRGPMDSNHLVALSPRAMAQLGGNANTPVRVRRVNAPENQRALLRNGEEAPLRMDTPRGLVEVLRRRLPAEGSTNLAGGVQPVEAVAGPAPQVLPSVSSRVPSAIPTAEVEPSAVANHPLPALRPAAGAIEPAPAPAPVVARAPQRAIPAGQGFVVQVGAFSVSANAQRAASQVHGEVSQQGNLYRVRTGPFATRAEAEASLANVRASGYSDARIYNGG
ncbi:MAG: SPOR domain-containing protein [Alteraurantiacibacter sp.]